MSEENDPLQLSDLPLKWMIDELDALPLIHPDDKIGWNEHKDIFFKNYQSKESTAIRAPMHDILKIGGGVSAISVFSWHILGRLLEQSTGTQLTAFIKSGCHSSNGSN